MWLLQKIFDFISWPTGFNLIFKLLFLWNITILLAYPFLISFCELPDVLVLITDKDRNSLN